MTESVPARSGDDTVLPSDVESLRPVTARFVFLYAFAYAGVWLALLTPMLVTIALRVRELAPHHAAGVLALTLGVGAFFAMVGNPVFGRLSDRTTSRFGMRRPWLVGGMLLGTASLAIIARAPDIPMLLFGWCLAQLAFNAVLAAIVAVLPDHVPAVQQGTVAGVLGMCMPIGQAGGTFLVQALPDSILLRFLVPACVGLVAVLLFAVLLPEVELPGALVAAEKVRRLVESARFIVDDKQFNCTVSLGAASFNATVMSSQALYESADRHLEQAKQGGRNKVVGQ